jgi:hypothetical protein
MARLPRLLLIPAAMLVVTAPLLVGCGGSEQAAEKTSEPRLKPDPDESAGNEGESGSGSSGEDQGGSSEEGSGDSGESGGSGESDDSIPDLDDLTESVPGLEEMGDCMEIAAAYGSLYFEALGGADGAAQAQEKAEDLKSVLPEDLHDDIDVVAEAIGTVAEEGLFSGTDALSSPEYLAADEAITAYLDEQCGGSMSGGSGDTGSGGA